VLPVFVAESGNGVIVNSLPWYGSHGGCLVDDEDGDRTRSSLLQHYNALLTSLAAQFATLIPSPDEGGHLETYKNILQPRVLDTRISQMTELPQRGDGLEVRLEQTLRQKTRNLVRKSLKQGFTFAIEDTDDSWRFLFDTHVENLAAIGGKAKPAAHFQALRDTLPAAWRRLAVTRLDGEPVAAILLVGFNRTIEYLTPVIKHQYRSLQPLSFAIWHAMLVAIADGYQRWNWGGTWLTQQSLRHFKDGWGADCREYTYFVNATADAVARFQRDPRAACASLPYYFVYPFTAVDEARSART
jgi:hypothetical protein